MKLQLNNPKKTLNKAYLKEKVSRNEIELFKNNLQKLFSKIDEQESEEHLKNLISDFLKDTWYKDRYEINTKGRQDLVIHSGKTKKDPVGVILEVKKPSNKIEMINDARPNTKAVHELILYYLRERVDANNINIKYLVITNIFEWYIIDELWFEKNVFRNNKLKKDYENWKLSGKDTKFFYDSISRPFLETIEESISCAYFDIREYKKAKDDTQLIALYKIFSPAHLLKQAFANDSNTLDKYFYTELLHIIGLEEVKESGKKLIQRKAKGNRDPGSLLESTINTLETDEGLQNLKKPYEFGKDKEERVYNVALELCIIWVNRILFLKLLEAQLIKYHKGDKEYKFLDIDQVPNYHELNTLFFDILAKPHPKRESTSKEKFNRIPYLNSSLFELSDLEEETIRIKGLDIAQEIEIHNNTILKNNQGKKKIGNLNFLKYFFSFLDAYDFSSEGSEEIQEENKTLISASVLGLIFEKLNGYKDGSFFTPGFITMYMCRETVRSAVIQKFKTKKGWDCENFSDLKRELDSYIDSSEKRQEANNIINDLKICDPAVGSGHFLVSALNEIIAIKSNLGILQYLDGSRIKYYTIEIENDELIIIDEESDEIYSYVVGNENKPIIEKQKIQEALFHEKETIIENCLFGVDINSNAVKICRLRLWIELLKNSYYTEKSKYVELETLPNIDINIKQGNSLINRFAFDADLSKALKSIEYNITDYKNFVSSYKNSPDKEERKGYQKLIDLIKGDFNTKVGIKDAKQKKLDKLNSQYNENYLSPKLIEIELSENDQKEEGKIRRDIETQINKLNKEIEEIKSNIIYKQAFEWRFEFPEVLDKDGKFLLFDAVIGNPPYIFGGNEGISTIEKTYFKKEYLTGSGKINLFTLFIERSFNILKPDGSFSFIIPNTFLRVTSYHDSRKFFLENFTVSQIADFGTSVFEDAITTAIVLVAKKTEVKRRDTIGIFKNSIETNRISQTKLREANYVIALNIDHAAQEILDQLLDGSVLLGDICEELIFGVVITKNKEEVVSDTPLDGWKPFLEGRDISNYFIKPIHQYLDYSPQKLHRPRTKEVFESGEKLLIQRITGGKRPLKVAYDNKKYYNKESINNLILREDSGFETKYILTLLNSSLINWFYNSQFTNQSVLTVNISKEYLSQIPIKNISPELQSIFSNLADYMLYLNNPESNPLSDVVNNDHISKFFDSIINGCVFELYFGKHMLEKGIDILSLVKKEIPQIGQFKNEIEKQAVMAQTYKSLRESDNEIRNRILLFPTRSPDIILPILKNT